jgi:hypothetical protein
MATIILFISLGAIVFICNANYLRELADKFGEWINSVVDKINKY